MVRKKGSRFFLAWYSQIARKIFFSDVSSADLRGHRTYVRHPFYMSEPSKDLFLIILHIELLSRLRVI